MITPITPGLFITGSNTDVGKTWIASLIARSLFATGRRVGVYKPVASGCHRDEAGQWICDDAVALWQAAGSPGSIDDVCPQTFAAPLAPHVAARAEGRSVDFEKAVGGAGVWKEASDIVIVEGAGGLLSPMSDKETNADLAIELGYPLIIVVANTIGAINQTLLTTTTAASYRGGLPVAGIVLCDVDERDDPSRSTNAAEIAARTEVPVLGRVTFGSSEIQPIVDWGTLADSFNG